jgi:hypothetical protein
MVFSQSKIIWLNILWISNVVLIECQGVLWLNLNLAPIIPCLSRNNISFSFYVPLKVSSRTPGGTHTPGWRQQDFIYKLNTPDHAGKLILEGQLFRCEKNNLTSNKSTFFFEREVT